MSTPAEPFDPGPLRDIEAQPSGGRWTLVYRQHFAHPPEVVWAALTEPGQLPAWAPYTADRNLGSTGPATLLMIDGDDRQPLPTTVTVAEAPRLLEHGWGDQLLRWELRPDRDGTELVLRHTVGERSELPSMAAGWHLCLLAAQEHLSGGRLGPVAGRAALDYGWEALQKGYAERLDEDTDRR
jgi:uncharacterized protein YndB with AHSA1/START domain